MLRDFLHRAKRVDALLGEKLAPGALDGLRRAERAGRAEDAEAIIAAALGLETFQSGLDPLDVWRARAGELRRSQERDLGAIMMRDACEPPRVGRADHLVEYPARPRRLDRIGHQRMPAQHTRVLVRHTF